MGMEFNHSAAKRVNRRIEAIAFNVENTDPLWQKIEAILVRHEREQWISKGGHFGTPWDQLDAKYAAWKKTHAPNSAMVLTGELLKSFTGDGKYAIDERTQSTFRFGSKDPVAHLHQYGSPQGQNPKRPLMRLPMKVRQEVIDAIRDHTIGRD